MLNYIGGSHYISMECAALGGAYGSVVIELYVRGLTQVKLNASVWEEL